MENNYDEELQDIMNEIDSINQQINQLQTQQANTDSALSTIETDVNNIQISITTIQSNVFNLSNFLATTIDTINNTDQEQGQQINELKQKDIMSTPRQITITAITPNTADPYLGITNRYNNGSYISMNGFSNALFENLNVTGLKIVIDSYGAPPQVAESSLFEITYLCWTNTSFYRTYCMLQIYPNRIWNNQLLKDRWELISNRIGGNDSYNIVNDQIYAPNGRWYWSFNQNYSNFGGPQNAWLVPQQGKINIIFGLPNNNEQFKWEVAVRCLDNTSMVENGSSWHLKSEFLQIW